MIDLQGVLLYIFNRLMFLSPADRIEAIFLVIVSSQDKNFPLL